VWTVPATVLRVVDGDTMKLVLDLGWNITLTTNCRVLGIDAPELATPEGKAARDFAVRLLPAGCKVTFISTKLDTYGRPLGHVICANMKDFAAQMIDAGHARMMGG
jgi:endonuclease YncB( thermonuclease family)